MSTHLSNDINRSMAIFFATAGVPFRTISNPFFKNIFCLVAPSYLPPSCDKLISLLHDEDNLVIAELGKITLETPNKTVVLDGWTNVAKKSIYALISVLPNRLAHLLCLKDLSAHIHSSELLASCIEQIMEVFGGISRYSV